MTIGAATRTHAMFARVTVMREPVIAIVVVFLPVHFLRA
jgi:hypothetical protein